MHNTHIRVLQSMDAAEKSPRPTVSVVVPAYNAADLVATTLESVLSQTYRDFEVIVVDDGSTDATADVVATFVPPVRYIYKENGGSASARNRGIREARGQYVAFLDSDDLWVPEKLEVQMQRMAEQPSLVWCYTDVMFIDSETGAFIYRHRHEREMREGDVLRPLLLGNFIAPQATIVRKDVLEEMGGFDESPLHRISEDWDLWLRIAARHPVAYVDQPLTKVRHHARRKTEAMDLQHALASRLAIIRKAVQRDPDRLGDLLCHAEANLYVNIGRKYLDREERTAARWAFWEALRRVPTLPEAWIYGFASLLPRPMLRQLGRLRQVVRRWRRGATVLEIHAQANEGALS